MSRLKERIENFNRAYNLFFNMQTDYILNKNNDSARLALTQAFEIVFELAWKVLKDYLHIQGIEATYPKEVIKEAFNKETIKNGQIWIDMLKDRNATSHEYNMDKLDKVLEKISTVYFDELCRFQEQVKTFDE